MKLNLQQILKIAVILIVALLGILVVFGVVLGIGWPWWVGFFLLLGLVGIGLGLIYVKKLLLRKREQKFVSQIIEQDDSYLKSIKDDEQEHMVELQQRWKQAVDALKSSHLRKYGNPLYVLPWYLVLGESGSGKTTAITSARLSSPFVEINRVSGISGTKNCDWWFFEQAIIIDTAGRYAIPIDEGRDKDEWQKFLNLLAKYRKKEPLSGLVVTLSADKLLETGQDVLEEDGRSIRRRIDELMRVLGSKFPVYLLVTKCDLIQGMTQFCDHLSELHQQQAMGFINQVATTDFAGFIDNMMHTIGERLRKFRLLFFQKADTHMIDPALLLFPEEFERLKPGLDGFIKAAFQENPYQETPILRGLFFSSGRQEGSPYSHFLRELGLIEEKEVLPGTSKGLFLHDFFADILPKERGMFVPTQRALEWNRLSRHLGLMAWIAVVIALCGLLSFSFVKNLSILRGVSREFSHPPVFQGELLTDVSILDRFRQVVEKTQNQNNNWWIPRFGLTESNKVEDKLKGIYCAQFYERFLVPFDKQIVSAVANLTPTTSGEVIGEYVIHLTRRINLLRARLKDVNFDELQAMPQPLYDPVLTAKGQAGIPGVLEEFSNLYLYRLVWLDDSSGFNDEMNNLQTLLSHILISKTDKLTWLAAWVNTKSSVPKVSMADFWGGSLSPADETFVPPSFTSAGKQEIDSLLAELEAALTDPLILSKQKLEFNSWYRNAYLDAWYNFGEMFPQGRARLDGKEEWQQLASKMATDQGPYFAVLQAMVMELEPFGEDENLPDWVSLVYEFENVRAQAEKLDATAGKGALVKATRKGATIMKKIEKKLNKIQKGMSLESQMAAARALNEYKKTIADIAGTVASSRKMAFDMAKQTFLEDPGSSQAPFYSTHNALKQLVSASSQPSQKAIWQLIGGPLDYLWAYSVEEAACELQNIWEQQVLVEVQGISDQINANELLLGNDGYAMQFVKGPASAFIGRHLKKGYYAKEALGRKMPFQSSFLSFMEKGSKPVRSSYNVTIIGRPTDVNSDALTKPHATRLKLQCADATQNLTNLHYPVKKVFQWSSKECGDVVFTIEVGNLMLTKKYSGSLGFAIFLNDFKTGQHTFYPGDFPNEKAFLQSMGIKYIKAKYRFEGHEGIIGLLKSGSGSIPSAVVTCWDQ